MAKHKYLLIALLALGAMLLLAAGLVYFLGERSYFASSQASLPPLQEIEPPSSLAELAEQYPALAHIITNPELDSVYKEFLVAYQEGGEEAAQELADKRGMLTPEGRVRITLILDTEENGPLVAQLKSAGIIVVTVYQDRVNVAVPMEMITAELRSEQPGGIFKRLTELEHVIGVQLPELRVPDQSPIEGEGVAIIEADDWHQAGFTGAGLHIGVLDLGFYEYEDLLGVELPDNVPLATFGWYDEEEVHGIACAEIIHEVAPDAQLSFAWYDGSDASMGEAVDWLLDQGVDIISHSAGGLIGPRDGSEWDAHLVDDLAAQGILWVNSAGNEGLSHYRGVFTDEDGDGFHEFAPGEERLALYNYGFVKVVLSWEDDWERAARDYELYLYDAEGNELAASQDTQAGEEGQEPFEGILYDTGGETVYAVVEVYDADRAVMLDLFAHGAEIDNPSPGNTICPPGDAVGSLTVGAVNWWDDTLANYSSQGPTSDGRLKPEISAPTGVSGHTYGDQGFDGTSASCPHIAGAAALVWQAHPEFSRQEVVDFLLAHTLDQGPSGPDTGYGYGRLQLSSPPAEVPPLPTPTTPPAPGATAIPSPIPISTPAPLPTPTSVTYVTPAPPPASETGVGAGTGLLALTGIGLVVMGLGCAGGGLLLVGAIGLLVMGRRSRSARPAPYPAPPPPAVPPQLRPTRCPSCGATVRAGARFCPQCGEPVTQRDQPRFCRHCGAPLREGADFCPRCGRSV